MYDALMPFRPPNVVQQMHIKEGVLLLNGRQLFTAAFAMAGCVVWAPSVSDGAAMMGVLRAAAHRKVFIGLTMQPRSADRQQLKQEYSPRKFFRSIMESVEQVPNAPPFFLHVQQPPIRASIRDDFEAVRDHIAGCVEAGFTSVGLDLSQCNLSQVSSAAVELLQPVLDFDLGIVMRLPRAFQAQHLETLRTHRVEPTVVLAPGPDETGEDAVEQAMQLQSIMGSGALGWLDTKSGLRGKLSQAPIKALIGGDRFDGFPRYQHAWHDPEKREAFVYIESLAWLDRLKQKLSASHLVEYLLS